MDTDAGVGAAVAIAYRRAFDRTRPGPSGSREREQLRVFRGERGGDGVRRVRHRRTASPRGWSGFVIGCGPPDEHGVDAVPPTGGALGDQPQTVHCCARARDRHAAQRLGQQTADGLHLVAGQVDVEQLAQVFHRQPSGDPDRSVPEVLDRRPFDVVLVGDLADDLLEDVLDRHQTGRCRRTRQR